MKTIIVHKTPHTYCSHPCVTQLANGEWLVAFSATIEQQPFKHPPDFPHFINLLCRSRDRGQSWEQPYMIPNYDWYGVETPGITQISNGDLLLNQWQFRWYPVELAKKLWSTQQEKVFFYNLDSRRWRPARTEQDWERHPFPYARADGGAYVHISTDNGYTWDITVPVDIAPYQGAFSPKGAAELSNGDLVLALGSHDYGPLAASFIVRSTDRGRSWQKPVEVARAPGLIFSEPSVLATQNDKLLVVSREETTGYIYQSESMDGGATWSPAKKLPFWGYPTHCICLMDGRIVIVYGRRREPFGIRAAVSEDEGQSWGKEIIIRDDLPGTYRGHNLGYPSVIEYEPGKLFTTYYGEDVDGVTCIQGTYFTL